MSQRAFLDDLVADMAEAFGDIGLCDTGIYLAPVADDDDPATPVACHVFIDDGAQQYGDAQLTTGGRTLVTLLLAELPEPQARAVIEVDGRRLVLDTPDEALQTTAESRWFAVEEAA